jgi:hypothetical protein
MRDVVFRLSAKTNPRSTMNPKRAMHLRASISTTGSVEFSPHLLVDRHILHHHRILLEYTTRSTFAREKEMDSSMHQP